MTVRRLAALAVATVLTLAVGAGCGRPATHAAWVAASSSPSPSPSPTPSPTPTQSCPDPVTAGMPQELADHVKLVPCFDPAPTPVPYAVPHGDGYAGWVKNGIPTDAPVAFITIDDGATLTPYAADFVKAAHVPVTLFLVSNYVAVNPGYFTQVRDSGRVMIEDHTVSHPELPGLGYDGVHHQLCDSADLLKGWFGTRPTYFRPPYGDIDNTSLKAAWDCGLQIGFYWTETVDHGNVYYQRDSGHIHKGDIILMHFRPAFLDDLLAAITAIKNSGLTPALLTDWVTLGPATGGAPFAAPPANPQPENPPPANNPPVNPNPPPDDPGTPANPGTDTPTADPAV